MEKRTFEVIKIGVCAYFLILFPCLKILGKLWFSSAQDGFAGYLPSFIIYILMLSAGIYLFNLYRKALASCPDNEKLPASTAAKFIGGCVLLADVLKTLVPSYVIILFEAHLNRDNFPLLLLPAVTSMPAFIAAAVMIRSGSLKKDGLEAPERIKYLCIRITLIYILVSSLYQLFIWLEPPLRRHSFSSIEIKWMVVELVFIIIVLTLFFAPLRMKKVIRDSDYPGFIDLSRRSFELGGWLILINGSSYVLNYLTRSVEYFFTAYGEFGYWKHLEGFIPGTVLVATGLQCIYYGARRVKPS